MRSICTILFYLKKRKTIPRNGGVLDVGDGSNKTEPRICNKCGMPIYVKTRPNALDAWRSREYIMCYLKDILDVTLHTSGKHINFIRVFRCRIGLAMWKIVGLPLDVFSLLERGLWRGIANNNKH
jgi:hypothetical protein